VPENDETGRNIYFTFSADSHERNNFKNKARPGHPIAKDTLAGANNFDSQRHHFYPQQNKKNNMGRH